MIDRPRAPLAARFGEEFVRRIDQAIGREDEPIAPRLPVPPYVTERRFAEPIALEADVLGTIEHLAHELVRLMERRGEGARLIEAALFRTDGKVHRIAAGTGAPLRDAARIRALFVERLAAIGDECDPGFGYDVMRLGALATERCDPAQTGLAGPDHAAELAHLIDRLGARFGLRRVTRLVPQDTHIPEYAVAAVAAATFEPLRSTRSALCVEGRATASLRLRGRDERGRSKSAHALPPSPTLPRKGEGADRAPPHSMPYSPPAQDSLAPTRPIRLFERPERDRSDRRGAGRPAGAVHLAARALHGGACRRPRAHRHGMVARRARPRADARLFPGREPRGHAGLALPRRPLQRPHAPTLVPARRVRMSNIHPFPASARQPRVETADATAPAYAELAVTTNFSFLRGGSHPEELVEQRHRTGHCRPRHCRPQHGCRRRARAYGRASRKTPTAIKMERSSKIAPSARGSIFADGTPDILAYPQDRSAWGRLTRLLTVGKSRGEKAECILFVDDLLEHIEGLNLIVMPAEPIDADATRRPARTLEDSRLRRSVWLAASMLYRGDDARRLARLLAIAGDACVPLIAVNDVLYHAPERRPLQDVVTCIREHVTIETAGRRLEANAERHLKSPQEMARLFRNGPERDRSKRSVSSTAATSRSMNCGRPNIRTRTAQGFATPQDALVAFVEGRRASGAIRTACRRRHPRSARQRARHHRRAQIRALFSDRP